MRGLILATAMLSIAPCANGQDFTHEVVVTPPRLTTAEEHAVATLIDEVAKRTQVRWSRANQWPKERVPVVAVGQRLSLGAIASPFAKEIVQQAAMPAEAYQLATYQQQPAVIISGEVAEVWLMKQ